MDSRVVASARWRALPWVGRQPGLGGTGYLACVHEHVPAAGMWDSV